jgi:RpiR family transcriptional regulator, carbohydrate utilization regulator
MNRTIQTLTAEKGAADGRKAGCLKKVRAVYPQLTKTERRLADFVMKRREIVFQSITDVVESSGVGYGSVMRFCRTLGYTGFQDFKVHLAQDLAVEEAQLKGHDERDFLARLTEEACLDIRNTAQMLSREQIDGAAKLLAKAGRVLVTGSAGSAVAAREIEYQLVRCGIEALAVFDNHMQRIRAATLGPKDAAFIVSFSGSTKDGLAVAETARKGGAKVLSLTNYAHSPLGKLSDFVLTTAIHKTPLSAETASKVSAQFVVDALCTRVREFKEDAGRMMRKTFDAASERQL